LLQELAKNKRQRTAVREVALTYRDADKIDKMREQLQRYRALHTAGRIDNTQLKHMQQLEKSLKTAMQGKAALEDETKALAHIDMDGLFGGGGSDDEEGDDDEDDEDEDGSDGGEGGSGGEEGAAASGGDADAAAGAGEDGDADAGAGGRAGGAGPAAKRRRVDDGPTGAIDGSDHTAHATGGSSAAAVGGAGVGGSILPPPPRPPMPMMMGGGGTGGGGGLSGRGPMGPGGR